MPPAAPLVRLDSVSKRFGGVVANDAVSLALHAGEVHALLGENGAGKSTLIGMLSGLLKPDSGSISIGGAPVAIGAPRDAIRLGIGTVFQHPTLVPTLTVAENLTLGRPWWRGAARDAVRQRLATLSARLGVRLDPDARAGALALGQLQQVEIIKALWRGERVLILDEPTSMLTPPGVAELMSVMRRLRDDGMAIVFVTHKLNEALDVADRVTVLRRGRVVGTPVPRDQDRAAATAAIVALMFSRDAGTETFAPPPAPATPHAVLEVTDLTVEAVGGEQGLRRISFTVAAGEVFGIAGVDGNGQRALAEALAGQRPATSGQLRLAGADITALGVAARQARGLRHLTDDRLGEGSVAPFSIATNLLLKRVGEAPFWRHGWDRPLPQRAHGAAAIARYDIRAPGPETPIGQLSGGNIQKALFARELDRAPRVLVCNKPTHGLDLANIQATRQRIAAGAKAGMAVVLISTELEELLALCHRIGVLDRGRLVGVVPNGDDAEAAVGALMVAAPA